MKNNRKVEVGQVRDWIGMDGETCVVLKVTAAQVVIRYLNSSEGEGTYTYGINRFMQKTYVVM